jgi:peroxiredoxin
MKKSLVIVFTLFLLAAGLRLNAARAADDNANVVALGATVADFTLPDINGKSRSLASLKGKKGTLVFFSSARCPMIVSYHERLLKIAQDYQAKGINVVAINSNATESLAEIKQHAADNKLPYTVLRDAGAKVADQFNAQVTPEIYLLDAANKLVYHGGVDDNRSAELVKNNYLRDALDALLAGKPIERAETRAFG